MTASKIDQASSLNATISNLEVRSWGDQPDYQLITDLLNQSLAADGIEHYATAVEMENYYSKLPGFSPLDDALFAFAGGEAVGWVSLQPRHEAEGDIIFRHYVALKPPWRAAGLRAHLIELIEDRAAERAEAFPTEQSSWLEASFSSGQSAAIELIEARSYEPNRYFFFMTRSLDKPIEDHPLPPAFHQRPITDDDLRPIWEAHHRAFSEHWGHPEMTEEYFQMLIENPLTDPSLWQVAWRGDEVAGMVLNFLDRSENEALNRQRGYTEDIAVTKPYRQQGLAKALITKSMLMFKEMGMMETALSVDTENPSGALQLYRGLGYKTDRKSIVYRKRLTG